MNARTAGSSSVYGRASFRAIESRAAADDGTLRSKRALPESETCRAGEFTRRRRRGRAVATAVGIVMLLSLPGCGDDDGSGPRTPTPTPTSSPTQRRRIKRKCAGGMIASPRST